MLGCKKNISTFFVFEDKKRGIFFNILLKLIYHKKLKGYYLLMPQSNCISKLLNLQALLFDIDKFLKMIIKLSFQFLHKRKSTYVLVVVCLLLTFTIIASNTLKIFLLGIR